MAAQVISFYAGQGSVIDYCEKQKINTVSSAEAEIMGIIYVLPSIIWVDLFIRSQGYQTTTILHQDNQATMQVAINGEQHCRQRTQQL